MPLPAELRGLAFRVRFVAEDANPANGGVEAAIDDLEVTSNLATCYQPPPPAPRGGGCAQAGTPIGGALSGAGLVLLAFALLRRRARPQ